MCKASVDPQCRPSLSQCSAALVRDKLSHQHEHKFEDRNVHGGASVDRRVEEANESSSLIKRTWTTTGQCRVLLLVVVFIAMIPPLYLCIAHDRLHYVFEKMDHGDPFGIYVPGTGFLGFWFTLGRLHSISNKLSHNYYCYSSACLAVTSSLLNVTLDDMIDISYGIQSRWKKGELSRFEVVPTFVDELVPTDMDATLLDSIRIITVARGVGNAIRKPRDAADLKDFLIATTYIPYVTGWGLWKADGHGSHHIDGGFLQSLHPQFNISLSTPPEHSYKIHANLFNPDLPLDVVREFWEAGRSHGCSLV